MGIMKLALVPLLALLALLVACADMSETAEGVDPATVLDAGRDAPACGPDAAPADGGPYPVCRLPCHVDPLCDDGDACTVDSRCGTECIHLPGAC